MKASADDIGMYIQGDAATEGDGVFLTTMGKIN
jgi:hypothetical protein